MEVPQGEIHTVITFNISQWRAWAPGLQTTAHWRQWSRGECAIDSADAAPDVSFLPAMQRRRLSRLARMAFAVGWPLAEGLERLPLVFVSRHGETPRTFEILSDLSHGQPLSPTQFSLSVHNAVIGLWSILRGETSEMTAIAADGDGFEQGVLEAAGLLHDGAPAVLLIVAEEQPPEVYRPWISDVPCDYALGLLLTPGEEWSLSLQGEPTAVAVEPHALSWLRSLLDERTTCTHTLKDRTWNWQRKA
ncbi:beta-ketoacyl synthase chain length factor [Pseudomonas sp. zfem002]|uniref:beta-ketoacyl synthase chain length factor n=1 Tax=Pseudomonas sp. zfem002 TaxID=3078197 RepID=UPI002928FFC7|nr:beta-ketoacyl synthase chain length factor [Pseudomonas sp. zfem002]MDU9389511.1 beta-ketoacyl synthase chain length factor [Pseudomonas sp. zfem002]